MHEATAIITVKMQLNNITDVQEADSDDMLWFSCPMEVADTFETVCLEESVGIEREGITDGGGMCPTFPAALGGPPNDKPGPDARSMVNS